MFVVAAAVVVVVVVSGSVVVVADVAVAGVDFAGVRCYCRC